MFTYAFETKDARVAREASTDQSAFTYTPKSKGGKYINESGMYFRVDPYVLGHPAGRAYKFRSSNEFKPHIIWLLFCYHATDQQLIPTTPIHWAARDVSLQIWARVLISYDKDSGARKIEIAKPVFVSLIADATRPHGFNEKSVYWPCRVIGRARLLDDEVSLILSNLKMMKRNIADREAPVPPTKGVDGIGVDASDEEYILKTVASGSLDPYLLKKPTAVGIPTFDSALPEEDVTVLKEAHAKALSKISVDATKWSHEGVTGILFGNELIRISDIIRLKPEEGTAEELLLAVTNFIVINEIPHVCGYRWKRDELFTATLSPEYETRTGAWRMLDDASLKDGPVHRVKLSDVAGRMYPIVHGGLMTGSLVASRYWYDWDGLVDKRVAMPVSVLVPPRSGRNVHDDSDVIVGGVKAIAGPNARRMPRLEDASTVAMGQSASVGGHRKQIAYVPHSSSSKRSRRVGKVDGGRGYNESSESDSDGESLLRKRQNRRASAPLPPPPPPAVIKFKKPLPVASKSTVNTDDPSPVESASSKPAIPSSASSSSSSSSSSTMKNSVAEPAKLVVTETKVCSICDCTTTPLWRRDRTTGKLLCNPCGLQASRKKTTPAKIAVSPTVDAGSLSDDEKLDVESKSETANADTSSSVVAGATVDEVSEIASADTPANVGTESGAAEAAAVAAAAAAVAATMVNDPVAEISICGFNQEQQPPIVKVVHPVTEMLLDNMKSNVGDDVAVSSGNSSATTATNVVHAITKSSSAVGGGCGGSKSASPSAKVRIPLETASESPRKKANVLGPVNPEPRVSSFQSNLLQHMFDEEDFEMQEPGDNIGGIDGAANSNAVMDSIEKPDAAVVVTGGIKAAVPSTSSTKFDPLLDEEDDLFRPITVKPFTLKKTGPTPSISKTASVDSNKPNHAIHGNGSSSVDGKRVASSAFLSKVRIPLERASEIPKKVDVAGPVNAEPRVLSYQSNLLQHMFDDDDDSEMPESSGNNGGINSAAGVASVPNTAAVDSSKNSNVGESVAVSSMNSTVVHSVPKLDTNIPASNAGTVKGKSGTSVILPATARIPLEFEIRQKAVNAGSAADTGLVSTNPSVKVAGTAIASNAAVAAAAPMKDAHTVDDDDDTDDDDDGKLMCIIDTVEFIPPQSYQQLPKRPLADDPEDNKVAKKSKISHTQSDTAGSLPSTAKIVYHPSLPKPPKAAIPTPSLVRKLPTSAKPQAPAAAATTAAPTVSKYNSKSGELLHPNTVIPKTVAMVQSKNADADIIGFTSKSTAFALPRELDPSPPIVRYSKYQPASSIIKIVEKTTAASSKSEQSNCKREYNTLDLLKRHKEGKWLACSERGQTAVDHEQDTGHRTKTMNKPGTGNTSPTLGGGGKEAPKATSAMAASKPSLSPKASAREKDARLEKLFKIAIVEKQKDKALDRKDTSSKQHETGPKRPVSTSYSAAVKQPDSNTTAEKNQANGKLLPASPFEPLKSSRGKETGGQHSEEMRKAAVRNSSFHELRLDYGVADRRLSDHTAQSSSNSRHPSNHASDQTHDGSNNADNRSSGSQAAVQSNHSSSTQHQDRVHNSTHHPRRTSVSSQPAHIKSSTSQSFSYSDAVRQSSTSQRDSSHSAQPTKRTEDRPHNSNPSTSQPAPVAQNRQQHIQPSWQPSQAPTVGSFFGTNDPRHNLYGSQRAPSSSRDSQQPASQMAHHLPDRPNAFHPVSAPLLSQPIAQSHPPLPSANTNQPRRNSVTSSHNVIPQVHIPNKVETPPQPTRATTASVLNPTPASQPQPSQPSQPQPQPSPQQHQQQSQQSQQSQHSQQKQQPHQQPRTMIPCGLEGCTRMYPSQKAIMKHREDKKIRCKVAGCVFLAHRAQTIFEHLKSVHDIVDPNVHL
ncbi:hypothetical protein BDR26DRAFT_872094 [Obelidium mucronatum]|nr:hypothetical protein BDR26DRAFT_872094 [Obelidium mucronatum]